MDFYFKNYCKLNKKEIIQILTMRNLKYIRKNMYSSNIIKFKNHLSWISSLSSRNDCQYYAVYINDELFGNINLQRIDMKNKIAEIGLYVKHNTFGAGIVLSYLGIEHFFNFNKLLSLYATVLQNNIIAYKMNINFLGYELCNDYSLSCNGNYFQGMILSLSKWNRNKQTTANLINKFYKIDNIIWS